MATDAAGNVYVADYGERRIQKFTGTGTYLTQWGSLGSGNGQFSSPISVATDVAGNVYVADTDNNRIQKFTGTGTYLTQWGSPGGGNGEFSTPGAVATDAAGNVYVADLNNHRIQKFVTYPTVAFVSDVGNDQGHRARLRILRTSADSPGSGMTVLGYDVYLRSDAVAGPSSARRGEASGLEQATAYLIPATGAAEYTVDVGTAVDATAASLEYSAFFVRAWTGPRTSLDSDLGYGFSVDNLPPPAPTPFTAAYLSNATHLHWGVNPAIDFATFRLYRGPSADFLPAPGNLVATQSDTGYVVTDSTWSYYKLSALDVHGNESEFAAVSPGGSASGSTPAGSGVAVPLGSNVQLTFQNVTGAGQSQLTLQTQGTPPPSGFKLAPSSPPKYFVLTTTATFTGTVTVCVTYSQSDVSGSEGNLKLKVYDTTLMPPKWVDITSSLDVTTNVICGMTTHFSEFALMEPTDPLVVDDSAPSVLRLFPCSPNPTSGRAQIRYDLSVASPVRLDLIDPQGRVVRKLEQQPMAPPGRHVVEWNGQGAQGEPLRAGIYFVRLEAEGRRISRAIALVR